MERYLWMRLGVGLRISEAEEAVIFANDGRVERLLQKIIAEGRFVPDGDTYISRVDCRGVQPGVWHGVRNRRYRILPVKHCCGRVNLHGYGIHEL